TANPNASPAVPASAKPATDRGAAAHHPASSAIPPAATTPANATPVTRSTARSRASSREPAQPQATPIAEAHPEVSPQPRTATPVCTATGGTSTWASSPPQQAWANPAARLTAPAWTVAGSFRAAFALHAATDQPSAKVGSIGSALNGSWPMLNGTRCAASHTSGAAARTCPGAASTPDAVSRTSAIRRAAASRLLSSVARTTPASTQPAGRGGFRLRTSDVRLNTGTPPNVAPEIVRSAQNTPQTPRSGEARRLPPVAERSAITGCGWGAASGESPADRTRGSAGSPAAAPPEVPRRAVPVRPGRARPRALAASGRRSPARPRAAAATAGPAPAGRDARREPRAAVPGTRSGAAAAAAT